MTNTSEKKTKKETLVEQVHKSCGGRIALIASNKRWELICIECKQPWMLSSPMFPIASLPSDFVDVKDGKKI